VLLQRKLEEAELFLFDLDGTLVKFHTDFLFDEAERILRLLNHSIVKRTAIEEGFRSFNFFGFVNPEEIPLSIFRDEFWKHFRSEQIPAPIILPGAIETLEFLSKQGKILALVTSRCEATERVCQDLESVGLLHFFKSVVPRASNEFFWSDKQPQISQTCINLGIPAEKSVMVGDVPPDASSARLSGVSVVISLLSGGLDRNVLEAENPDYLLDGVHQIPGLFSKPNFGDQILSR
jgi:phosphoglycolate phosphatase-like HAD superfamily hydrolase